LGYDDAGLLRARLQALSQQTIGFRSFDLDLINRLNTKAALNGRLLFRSPRSICSGCVGHARRCSEAAPKAVFKGIREELRPALQLQMNETAYGGGLRNSGLTVRLNGAECQLVLAAISHETEPAETEDHHEPC
jgi:hypothetical protein